MNGFSGVEVGEVRALRSEMVIRSDLYIVYLTTFVMTFIDP